MPSRTRIRQPLHHQHTDTLTPPRTIRRRRERLTPPITGQPPLTRKLHKRPRRRHHRHTTGQRQIDTPPTATPAPPNATPPTTTNTPYPPSPPDPPTPTHTTPDPTPHSPHCPSPRYPSTSRRTADQQRRIILTSHPREHTRPATPQRPDGSIPAALQRLPRHLQQQPLLRIHRQRLTRRHPEKPRIEPPRTMQKPTRTRIRRTRTTPDPDQTTPPHPNPDQPETPPPHHHPQPPNPTTHPATPPHPENDTPSPPSPPAHPPTATRDDLRNTPSSPPNNAPKNPPTHPPTDNQKPRSTATPDPSTIQPITQLHRGQRVEAQFAGSRSAVPISATPANPRTAAASVRTRSRSRFDAFAWHQSRRGAVAPRCGHGLDRGAHLIESTGAAEPGRGERRHRTAPTRTSATVTARSPAQRTCRTRPSPTPGIGGNPRRRNCTSSPAAATYPHQPTAPTTRRTRQPRPDAAATNPSKNAFAAAYAP